MIDIVKKAVLTGIGVASLTTDKIEEFSREFIEKSKMSEQEGLRFVQDMVKRGKESQEALKKQTESVVKDVLDKMNLAKSEEVVALKEEIAGLKEELEALKKKE